MSNMVKLPDKWGPVLIAQPESGMGYQIATITLIDGRSFEHVVIDSGYIVSVNGATQVPFNVDDICQISVTG